jgi:hypothetical protein
MTSVQTIRNIVAGEPEWTRGELINVLTVLVPDDYWGTCADWQVHLSARLKLASNLGGVSLVHKNGRMYIGAVEDRPGYYRIRTLPMVRGEE